MSEYRHDDPERVRRCHLHFDCVSGIAGDMTLGALIDLGVPVAMIRDTLDRVGIGGDRLSYSRVLKRGISAVNVQVRVDDGHGHDHNHDHGHDHDHAHDDDEHEHEHRHYREIKAMITGAGLPPDTIFWALDMFDRVARVEARIHGTSIDDVAFHEVGAIDSIVDIVGTAAALAWLQPDSVSCARVAVGSGQVRSAHGILPVPAPATVGILTEVGAPMYSGGVDRELCTPTGAAILASAVTTWAGSPTLEPVAIGYGAGDRELADRANVVRVTAGRLVAERAPAALAPTRAAAADGSDGRPDGMWRLEANIDDMAAELCEYATEQILAAGAVDVWWTPIVMKKSRPALMLSALAPLSARDEVAGVIMRETTTIGVRFDRVERAMAARTMVTVDTPYGPLPLKVARIGERVINAAPEYEACRQAAHSQGVPLKQVYAAAMAAWSSRSG